MQYEDFSEDGKAFIEKFKNFMEEYKKTKLIYFVNDSNKYGRKFLRLGLDHIYNFDIYNLPNTISFLYPKINHQEQLFIYDFLFSKNFFLQLKEM